MSVKIINGNLFDSKAKFICNPVNCKGYMDSGIALQVKQRFPHIYNHYLSALSMWKMLGEIQLVACDPKYVEFEPWSIWTRQEQYICNMFTDGKYGDDGKQYTSIEALEKCFNDLARIVRDCRDHIPFCDWTVAIPYMIGCCIGDSDYGIISKMIEEKFDSIEVELWKYEENNK